jgi:PAS domain S-box-containing protein
MAIVVCSPDAEVRDYVRKEVAAANGTVADWKASGAVPAGTHIAIIDGLEDVVVARNADCHIVALVTREETSLFPECPRQVSSFIMKPLREGELAARLRILLGLPSRRELVHQRLLSHAVEKTSDIIEIGNPDAVIEYVNPAHKRLLGYEREDAIGKTPAQLIRSDQHTPEFFRKLDDTLARGETWRGTLISKAMDGRLLHFDTTVTPVVDAKGHHSHNIAVKRDITERLARREALIEANKALEHARDAAVAASKAKSEFLANMSHELRTPLNAIIGYSELLMDDIEDEAAITDLERIKSAGGHLLSLINDVLDISKIEAERIDLSPEEVSVSDLAAALESTLQPLAAKNKNQFAVHCSDDVGTIIADPTRLKQVMLNLLSNACKFTKDGDVSLEIARFERGKEPWLELRVKDSGIGISAAQKARLFQPFVQADSSTTREYGGTGLGLVISKRLVEMMGGQIDLDSKIGQGSTFTIRLPIDGTKTARHPATAPNPDSTTVLLIDDDPDVREVFSRALTRRGFEVEQAANGFEGMELAGRLSPAAIVLDVKMPKMSGWEVLSKLKLSATTANIPVIMLTVLHQEEVGQALGAADYLTKPVAPDTLSDAVVRHTGFTGKRSS